MQSPCLLFQKIRYHLCTEEKQSKIFLKIVVPLLFVVMLREFLKFFQSFYQHYSNQTLVYITYNISREYKASLKRTSMYFFRDSKRKHFLNQFNSYVICVCSAVSMRILIEALYSLGSRRKVEVELQLIHGFTSHLILIDTNLSIEIQN